LLRHGGAYAALWRRQSGGFREAGEREIWRLGATGQQA
jgi:hypothetical protein